MKSERYRHIGDTYTCFNLGSLSVIMIYNIVEMRRHLQATFYFSYEKNTFESALNFLKMRTVEIEGRW